MKRAETLAEMRLVTEPIPLEGEALHVFYVPADSARDPLFPPSSVLHDYLYQAAEPLRLLFASHPGAGKSTELNRLMANSEQDFWFVRISARQELDLASLSHIDLMLALMERLYQAGHDDDLIRDERVIEPVRSWLNEVVHETKVVRDEEISAEAGVGLNGPIAQIIGVFAKLRGAFSLSRESAETVRQQLQPRIADLRQYCNQVLNEIALQLGKRSPLRRLFVVIDDTDKLDIPVARELFVSHTGLLADLQTSIIYTVPLFLVHSPDRQRLESYFEILTLPMIKTHSPQGIRFDAGWDVLHRIVAQRMNVAKLIDPSALDLAIEKTGGVLRDLFWALREASIMARYSGGDLITSDAMRYSLDRLATRYSQSIYGNDETSTEELYGKMREIARSPLGKVPLDHALQLLLYTQAVIEYNGRGWYDLHPLMRETLDEMRYLGDVAP
jgi:hypothetical protein